MKKGLIALGIFCFLVFAFFYGRFFMAGKFMEEDDCENLENLREKLVYSIEARKFQEAKARGEHLKKMRYILDTPYNKIRS